MSPIMLFLLSGAGLKLLEPVTPAIGPKFDARAGFLDASAPLQDSIVFLAANRTLLPRHPVQLYMEKKLL